MALGHLDGNEGQVACRLFRNKDKDKGWGSVATAIWHSQDTKWHLSYSNAQETSDGRREQPVCAIVDFCDWQGRWWEEVKTHATLSNETCTRLHKEVGKSGKSTLEKAERQRFSSDDKETQQDAKHYPTRINMSERGVRSKPAAEHRPEIWHTSSRFCVASKP